jgi:hypothetical protein
MNETHCLNISSLTERFVGEDAAILNLNIPMKAVKILHKLPLFVSSKTYREIERERKRETERERKKGRVRHYQRYIERERGGGRQKKKEK